jgi:hypothetical protein
LEPTLDITGFLQTKGARVMCDTVALKDNTARRPHSSFRAQKVL